MTDKETRDTASDDVPTAGARTDCTGETTDSSATIDALSDPTTLVDRDDVEAIERTYPHEDADHCETDAAGRSVVGVTNDADEALLLVHEAGGHVKLPNSTVGPDGDYAAIGRRTVDEATGIAVEVETVERVRTVEHVVEKEDEPRSTNYHVVFRASPVMDGNDDRGLQSTDGPWQAGWYDEMPVPVESDQPVAVADGIDDVRLFLE